MMMSSPELSDNQVNQLFLIDNNGFICRKKITGFANISATSKNIWNRKANKPIEATVIRLTGYKAEKTEYLREVLLYGRQIADKNIRDIRRASYQNRNVKIEDELEEPVEPYEVDNSDLFIPDFVDNSASQLVNYL